MALITLPIGISLVNWTGPATTLSTAPWFTTMNLKGISKQSANRQAYITATPGSGFPPFTQVVPGASGQLGTAYIFNVKAAFSLDDSLIGLVVPNSLAAVFPAGATNTIPMPITTAMAGSYLLPTSSTGLSAISYSRSGNAITGTVALAAGDIVSATATAVSGNSPIVLTLVKQ